MWKAPVFLKSARSTVLQAFRQDVVPWTRVGEQAFLNARRLPFEFKLR